MTLVSLGVELLDSVTEFELELKSIFSENDSSNDISSWGVVGGLFDDPRAYPSVILYSLFKIEAWGVFEIHGSARNIFDVILFEGSFVSNLPTRFFASFEMSSLLQLN